MYFIEWYVVRHCSVVVEKKYKRRVLYKIRGQMNSETSASCVSAVALARARGVAAEPLARQNTHRCIFAKMNSTIGK